MKIAEATPQNGCTEKCLKNMKNAEECAAKISDVRQMSTDIPYFTETNKINQKTSQCRVFKHFHSVYKRYKQAEEEEATAQYFF